MSVEFTDLEKHISDDLTIFPYRDIDDDSWPTYLNDEGKWVEYNKGWKDIGFTVPYPTIARLRKISDISQGLEFSKRSLHITTGDPEKLARYFVNNLITGITGITQNGKPMKWDNAAKEWMFNQFRVSGFLLSNFRSTYELAAGKMDLNDREDEEDFFGESESTSDTYSTDTPLSSKKTGASSPTKESEDE